MKLFKCDQLWEQNFFLFLRRNCGYTVHYCKCDALWQGSFCFCACRTSNHNAAAESWTEAADSTKNSLNSPRLRWWRVTLSFVKLGMNQVHLALAVTEKDLQLLVFVLHSLRFLFCFVFVSNIMQSKILFQKFSLGSHKTLPFFSGVFPVWQVLSLLGDVARRAGHRTRALFWMNLLCFLRMEFYQIDQLSRILRVERARLLVLMAFYAG